MRIKQRIRIFAACEGGSERSYVRWLNAQADELGLHLHFDARVCGGGDLLALVQEAEKLLVRAIIVGGAYRSRFLLYDADRLGDDATRDRTARALALRIGLTIIHQQPNHEGLLLRHMPGCGTLYPPSQRSLVELQRQWQEYRKGMDHLALARRLTIGGLKQAAVVERDLAGLLRSLGFPI